MPLSPYSLCSATGIIFYCPGQWLSFSYHCFNPKLPVQASAPPQPVKWHSSSHGHASSYIYSKQFSTALPRVQKNHETMPKSSRSSLKSAVFKWELLTLVCSVYLILLLLTTACYWVNGSFSNGNKPAILVPEQYSSSYSYSDCISAWQLRIKATSWKWEI